MNFDQDIFSELRKNVRDFVAQKVEPLALKMDREDYFPEDVFKEMGRMGYLGITIPEEYGGTGLGYIGQAIIEEELGYSSPSLALSYGAHSNLTLDNLFRNGDRMQRERFVPDLCNGNKIGSLGLTEPSSGSDALAMKSSATLSGEYYILNGSKTYITNAPYSDIFLVYARTGDAYTAFIVLSDDEGFSRGKKFDKMGMRGSPTGEIFFDNIKLNRDRVVGEENGGKNIILGGLNSERVILSFIFVGLAKRALTEATQYSIDRKQFGEPLHRFEMIQDKLAMMYTEYRASKLLAYDALSSVENNNMDLKSAASSILYSAIVAERVSREAIQIMGGNGYMKDTGVERFLRDAILGQIGAGTTEIRKKLIASSLIKDFRKGRGIE
ncbi:MAG: acyl-CoA dehydrogenase family protein [Candidatus Thermoplasmatota archaeon]|jgi:isovaleryl-CoA dehydrogenase|nr:acyl-CoA dehydrogenase family protein [Candidatus Thermoplasmatota archaeon]